ncbi:MAG: aldo/keto reductase [Steroidobacteraceae bacterium]|jgi:aryl-alcohol dehydrogenase-like predicted oxidoreductase|nr:aldo/keto reductase [Steroidobacteraceae bacterium]
MQRRDFLRGGLVSAAAAGAAGIAAVPAARAQGGAGPAPGADAQAARGRGAPASSLIARRIPATGESIPVIGLGTSGPFEVGPDPSAREPLSEVLEGFFAGGATLIDTSPMYSTAEAVLGDLLTPAMQQRAFVATKVWTRGEQEGIAQMTRSASLMKRKVLDLVQVHNLLDLDVHLRTLRRWKDEGRVRYVGITHYTVAAQAELAAIVQREKLDFVQFNYSVTSPEAEQRLLPLCADRGVATLVNRAFDDGKVFAKLRDRPLPPWASEIECTSWAQLLLKFVIAHPAVTCVIPATGKLRNLRDNLGAGRGPLPDARLRQAIAEAVARA